MNLYMIVTLSEIAGMVFALLFMLYSIWKFTIPQFLVTVYFWIMTLLPWRLYSLYNYTRAPNSPQNYLYKVFGFGFSMWCVYFAYKVRVRKRGTITITLNTKEEF